jgi:secreted trypsin-like serine protease
VRVEKVVVHPNYGNLNNDLALFKLREDVKFNRYTQPICLIGESVKNLVSYSRNRKCYVIGYGFLEHTKYTTKLQKLRIKPRIPSDCNHIGLTRGAVCIGPDNEEHVGSTCQGDSGGPNFCYEEETNTWRQFGVVSYGPKGCDRPAGDKWTTGSVDLTSYRSWILNTMGQG